MRTLFALALTIFGGLSQALMASTHEERLACVREICGPDSMRSLLNGKGSYQTSPSREDFMILRRIYPAIDEILHADRKSIQMFLKNMADPDFGLSSGKFSEDQKIYLAFAALMTVTTELPEGAISESAGVYKINPRELPANLSSLTAAELEWTAKTYAVLANAESMQLAGYFENRPFEFMVKMLKWRPADLPRKFGELLRDAYRYRQLRGEASVAQSDIDVLTRASKGQKLSDLDRKKIVDFAHTNYVIKFFDDKEARRALLGSPFSLRRVVDLLALKIKPLSAVLNSAARMDEMHSNLSTLCLTNAAATIASSTSELNIERLKLRSEQVKASARAVLPRYLSGADLASADAAVKSTTFIFPASRTQAISDLQTLFAMDLSDSRIALSALSREASEQELATRALVQLILIAMWHTGTEPIEEILFSSSYTTCKELQPRSPQDATLSEAQLVQVGWQSAAWQEYGAGLMAHEIGHIVETAVKPESLKTQMQCQIDQHKLVYGGKASSDQGTEDWADTFAMSVINNLRKKWAYASNFGCALLQFAPGEEALGKWALDLSADSSASHSNSFFRILRIQTGMGGLPKSCAQLSEIAGKPLNSCIAPEPK